MLRDEEIGKMLCRWCGKGPLEQRGHKPRLFCNASCRNKAWQKKRAEKLRQEQEGSLREAQDERDREITASLDEAAQAIQRARVVVSGEGEDSP